MNREPNPMNRPSRVKRRNGLEAKNAIQEAAWEGKHKLRHWLVSLGLLAFLTLLMFGDALFASKPIVLSNRDGDLFHQFIHWRAFGFGELRHGNLALWNPHLFSGAPFFGGFQSALLYPPNALFLFLPLDMAINWGVALHVFLAGVFTYAWAARCGLWPPACFLTAVIFMFCGAHFLHIYAGHLPNLCTMIWAPLLFLAIDGIFESPSLGWSLLGMFAVAMQVLAGHPQYVYYTGLAAAIYCALCLIKAQKRTQIVPGLAGIVVGGVALSAVQLFTSLGESREMLRSIGFPRAVAAQYSFPPENILTLLTPNIFGDMKSVPYWGRWCGWEMSLFIGVSGLVLAVLGAVWGERRQRRFSVVMVGLLLLLALGSHTPLFKFLHHWLPGFDQFRGSSKFGFLASLFLALLAGVGFHELLKGRRLPRVFTGCVAGVGVVLLIVAALVRPASAGAVMDGWWHSVMLAVRDTREIIYLTPDKFADPAYVIEAVRMTAQSLLVGGMTLVIVALSLFCVRSYRRTVTWLLLVLAVLELFLFARMSLEGFDFKQVVDPVVRQYVESHPGDYRVLNLASPNVALSLDVQDIWGYDPGVLLRYAQLLGFTQGVDPNRPDQFIEFSRLTPLYGMFRMRAEFVPENGQLNVYENTNYLPRLLLVQRYRVLPERNEIFSVLTNASFNPREEVILETPPEPRPVPSPDAGVVRIVDSSTDRLTIEADVKSPSLLLVTDAYAKGWRAKALPGSAQTRYQVMPANYCLRAIPLSAGHHSLELEYSPFGFRLGRWVSLISLGVFLALAGLCVFKSVPNFSFADGKEEPR